MFPPKRLCAWLIFAGLILTTFILTGTTIEARPQVTTPTPSSLSFNFARVENNPILEPGASGQWDSVSVRFPHIVHYDDQYYLFYGTFQTMTAPVEIGFAQSADGIHWTKFDSNPIVQGSGSGFDAFGVTRPVILVESDGKWVMYYSSLAAKNTVFGKTIGRATAPSPAGPWTNDKTPVLEVGGTGEWDMPFLFPDSVLKDDDQYVMYYSSGFMVGRATSTDGIHWQKYNDPNTDGAFAKSDPVLKRGDKGSWDSFLAWGSNVQHTQYGWEMFYYGGSDPNGGPNIKVGYAYSDDGIAWTKYPDPVIGFEDRQAFFPSFILNADLTYNVYYAVTFGNAATDIYLSTGTITRNGQ